MNRRKARRLKSDMNVVPYIDVMLVLLVIFMIAAPLMQSSVEVRLPEVSEENTREQKSEPELIMPLILTIDQQGLFYLNIADTANALNQEEILQYAQAYLQRYPEIEVYVSGDERASYAWIMQGIDYLRMAGAGEVNLSSRVPE